MRNLGAPFLYSCLCFSLVLAGCGGRPTQAPAPTVTAPITQPTAQQSGYPAPPTAGVVPTSVGGYPGPAGAASPTAPAPLPVTIPTPQTNAGVVTGLLVSAGGRPYPATLYLGKAIYPNQPGFEPLIGFSDQDPSATQDPTTGKFVFADVPPGTYGLVIWTPVGNTVIVDPATGAHLLFEVPGGQVTDLGEVTVN